MAIGALHAHRRECDSEAKLVRKALKSYQTSVSIVREELVKARPKDLAPMISTTLVLGLFEVPQLFPLSPSMADRR